MALNSRLNFGVEKDTRIVYFVNLQNKSYLKENYKPEVTHCHNFSSNLYVDLVFSICLVFFFSYNRDNENSVGYNMNGYF